MLLQWPLPQIKDKEKKQEVIQNLWTLQKKKQYKTYYQRDFYAPLTVPIFLKM